MADAAFFGFVESTLDALLVFEGCKRGFLTKITRRLQEFEKRALVISGAVFVFDEEETGIKRWTDGLTWSPSRTLGNFLVYRELDKKAPQPRPGGRGGEDDGDDMGEAEARPGSSRRPNTTRLMGGLTSKADPVDDAQDIAPPPPAAGPSHDDRPGSSSARGRSLSEAAASLQLDKARERALVGSLTSSYRFRADGLVKKTISLNGLHLIGYYRIDDVTSGRLRTPSSHSELKSLVVSPGFLAPSLFRIPPIVEVGPDGQLRYKAEADAPVSPVTQSGSSQGFGTPSLSQSRPTSSSDAFTPFSTLLPTSAGSWDYTAASSQTNSPRRGATATFRSSNRFDPYASSSRYSPSGNFPTNAAYPFPLIPNPPGSFPTIGEVPVGSESPYQARTPPIEQLSTSAPPEQRWTASQAASSSLYQSLPPSRRGYVAPELPMPHSPSVYQPRQAMPYAPTSDANNSSAIFAYNPPPPLQAQSQTQYQPLVTAPASPPRGYQPYHPYHSYNGLPLGTSQAGQATMTAAYPVPIPPSVEAIEASQSPFATPPSTAHVRAGHPSPSTYTLSGPSPHSLAHSHSNSTHSSPAPPALPISVGWSSGRRPSGHQASLDSAASLQQAASLAKRAELSPHSPVDLGTSRFAQQQQQQQQQQQPSRSLAYDYLRHAQGLPYSSYPLSDGSPSTASLGPSSSHGSRPRSGYAPSVYNSPHSHASGLVGSSTNEDVVPASGHGLEVSAYGDIVPVAQGNAGLASLGTASVGGLGIVGTRIGRNGSASGSLSPSSYGAHLVANGGLRQPPPPLPSVSLSSNHVYASPPLQQSPHFAAHPSHHVHRPSPHPQTHGHLTGMLERDGMHRAQSTGASSRGIEWVSLQPQPQPQPQLPRGIKREAEEPLLPQPLSPSIQNRSLYQLDSQPLSASAQTAYAPSPLQQQLQQGLSVGGGVGGGGGNTQWWGGATGDIWGQPQSVMKKDFPQG
ncbi:hypothetical protein JCM11641_003140 [Rhodosporidiobolus odoratus]